jgi:hypothetical protein
MLPMTTPMKPATPTVLQVKPLPTTLPNQTTCTPASSADCNGWTAVGPEQFGTGQLALQGQDGTARLFVWSSATTLCQYQFRTNGQGPFNTSNGMLCFDTTTCAIQAFDSPGAPQSRAPTPGAIDWSEFAPAGPETVNCSFCHTSGPVLPMKDLWGAAQAGARDLNATCASVGGPKWLGTPWSDGPKVAPPPSCASKTCHPAGFIGAPPRIPDGMDSFCSLVATSAFGPVGSMASSGFVFSDASSCSQFAEAMGCAPSDFNCGN